LVSLPLASRDVLIWRGDGTGNVGAASGPAARLILSPDHSTIKADGRDLSFVTITIADKSGLLVPRSKNRIVFSISGPGEIIATDNGNAIDLESFQSKERNAFNGLALAIIRSTVEPGPGTIILKAESPGLKSAEVKIQAINAIN